MANQLAKVGAQPSRPTRYGVLWHNNFYLGVVTQRNPLHSFLQHIEEEWYGTQPCLINGANTEISTKLTLTRRPGLTIYNSQTFPAINRFYDWHLFTSNAEQIRVIADTASAIYDATGHNTKTLLFTKSPGAGSTYFQSVGNNLYFSDGVDLKKIVGSLTAWTPTTSFPTGTYIIDPNGNIQWSIGSQTATITNIQISGGNATVYFSPETSLDIAIGTELTLAGLTTVPALNGTTLTVSSVPSSYQIVAPAAGSQAFAVETGTATTGTGISGAVEPTWLLPLNSITQDGGNQWWNSGSQVENWGITAPTTAPSVSQGPAPSLYNSWAANTWYSPLFVIFDGTNLQILTTAGGTSVAAHPVWAATQGATTTDNNGGHAGANAAIWTCSVPGTWAPNTPYALNQSIVFSNTTFYPAPPPAGGVSVTITYYALCTKAGTSGTVAPGATWINGYYQPIQDNTAQWTIVASGYMSFITPLWPGTSQILSLTTTILDSNGNLEKATTPGESRTPSHPTWETTTGATTTDNTVVWTNEGPYSSANTGNWYYSYSYVNSVTDTVSTASPASSPILLAAGNQVTISGVGSSDPQVDTIYIWRSVQQTSVSSTGVVSAAVVSAPSMFYLGQIPNPGGGSNWSYTDTTPDVDLNELIEAPVADSNNPPPVNLSAMAYHLERIWGAVNNTVYSSNSPGETVGDNTESWDPLNFYEFPDTVTRLYPTTNGLFVFTVAEVYVIQGLGTSASPFFSTPFLDKIGLASYDAFTVNGALVYLYTTDNQVLTMDPSAGMSEIGFPIGDQFGPNNGTGTFLPTTAQLTWNYSGSQEKALYVSDFTGNWWRMLLTPSPETGATWSPMATIAGGFSAVQSIETTPGVHNLLLGPPSSTPGPILERNLSVFTDNGASYNSYAVVGSLVLAQPGQLAYVKLITTDCEAVGTPIVLQVQLDEISPPIFPGSSILSAGQFETLFTSVQDPTQLSPSNSVYAQRFYLSQTQEPAVCRHIQILVSFGKDAVKNEMLSLSIYGSFEQEG